METRRIRLTDPSEIVVDVAGRHLLAYPEQGRLDIKLLDVIPTDIATSEFTIMFDDGEYATTLPVASNRVLPIGNGVIHTHHRDFRKIIIRNPFTCANGIGASASKRHSSHLIVHTGTIEELAQVKVPPFWYRFFIEEQTFGAGGGPNTLYAPHFDTSVLTGQGLDYLNILRGSVSYIKINAATGAAIAPAASDVKMWGRNEVEMLVLDPAAQIFPRYENPAPVLNTNPPFFFDKFDTQLYKVDVSISVIDDINWWLYIDALTEL